MILILILDFYLNLKVEQTPPQDDYVNPCASSPCGPYAECRVTGNSYSCSCLADFIGNPPNCRPECVTNSDCSNNLACINRHCKDPCPGACGFNAECRVVSHTPVCVCINGYEGDAFIECHVKQQVIQQEQVNPCVPSPCGANAVCRDHGGVGSCECLPEYFGNPYDGCRPECVLNSDCTPNRACIRNKCENPCQGMCGQNADCQVVNHLPMCQCRVGYTGDSYTYCRPIIEDQRMFLILSMNF